MMKFAVVREHRDFFRKNQWLECEGVLSGEETQRIAHAIDQVLAARLKVKPDALQSLSPDQIFAAAYDVWRGDAAIKRVLLSRKLAEIAGELTETRPLRFGYDTVLPCIGPEASGPLKTLADTSPTLNAISGIQNVVCGGVIHLSGPTPGNVTIYAPDCPLPFQEMLSGTGCRYLLFVYVNANAVYVRQEMNPHLHDFKQIGYQFGDKLNDVLNPIVYP